MWVLRSDITALTDSAAFSPRAGRSKVGWSWQQKLFSKIKVWKYCFYSGNGSELEEAGLDHCFYMRIDCSLNVVFLLIAAFRPPPTCTKDALKQRQEALKAPSPFTTKQFCVTGVRPRTSWSRVETFPALPAASIFPVRLLQVRRAARDAVFLSLEWCVTAFCTWPRQADIKKMSRHKAALFEVEATLVTRLVQSRCFISGRIRAKIGAELRIVVLIFTRLWACARPVVVHRWHFLWHLWVWTWLKSWTPSRAPRCPRTNRTQHAADSPPAHAAASWYTFNPKFVPFMQHQHIKIPKSGTFYGAKMFFTQQQHLFPVITTHLLEMRTVSVSSRRKKFASWRQTIKGLPKMCACFPPPALQVTC